MAAILNALTAYFKKLNYLDKFETYLLAMFVSFVTALLAPREIQVQFANFGSH